MSDSEYFSHLYQIASALNKEYSLHSALKISLEKTIQLLELETGWIWLMNSDKTVYLAASYNLPPALKEHPERLSGKCYCIEKYFLNNIERAQNISEIACTRLHNIKSGTLDLKFHATIPINIGDEKVGLINVLSKEKQELSKIQLCILNTIGELIGIAIQRTRAQETYSSAYFPTNSSFHEVLSRVFSPQLEALCTSLEQVKSDLEQAGASSATKSIKISINHGDKLKKLFSHVINESTNDLPEKNTLVHYPTSPLTSRELELLVLVKKGYTNKQIGESLFISERTVKFHISSILSKLFATTRTEAVNIALKRGLISF